MSEYKRSTRECTLDNMTPLLASAIHAHIEQYELESIYDSILICCETTSTKETKKLFRSKTIVDVVALVLTPQWLIRAGSQNGEMAGVFSERLVNLHVEDYEKSSMYKMIPDRGIIVSGFRIMSEGATLFLGFGAESVGQKFREMLRDAMGNA